MKRRHVFVFVLLIWGALSALAAENDVEFNIRYYDKRVYYLEQDPILVLITLTNRGPYPFHFRLADERAFSVDFDVRTNSNRAVAAADILVRRRSQSQQVFFREISIAAGESFSFVEDLRDYAALTQSGAYVVQARIYPGLYHTVESASRITPGMTLAATGLPLESNRLTLTIRPKPLLGPDDIPLELDVETDRKSVV